MSTMQRAITRLVGRPSHNGIVGGVVCLASPRSVPPTPIAGPSRYTRSYATPSETLNDGGVSNMQAGVGEGSAVADSASAPTNLTFHPYTGKGKGIQRSADREGFTLHEQPADEFSPIVVPMSSLASEHPTQSIDNSIELPSSVFAEPLRRDILHRCVVWYLSTLRQGNQATKSRSTVAYSGRKLRPQKGSGKARVGDASSGTRRGGAPIFPLTPRDHAQLLPRKVRAFGMRVALSSKLRSGLLRVVDDLNEGHWQGTNEARRALCDKTEWIKIEEQSEGAEEMEEARVTERFGSQNDLNVLFVYGSLGVHVELFDRNVRNLPGIEVLSAEEVQVYHLLKHKWLVLDRAAVEYFSTVLGSEFFLGEETDMTTIQPVDAQLEA